jgi:hypothetical protein
MSTRSFCATSLVVRVCGAWSVGEVSPSIGFGWSCLWFGAVCGSLLPHIGGSSTLGEVSSTASSTVSPIQVYVITLVVSVVKRKDTPLRGSPYRQFVLPGLGGVSTLDERRGSPQAWRGLELLVHHASLTVTNMYIAAHVALACTIIMIN